MDDLVGAIHHALAHETMSGPVNAVSPHPVTNLEFTKTLGRVLHRPTIFPMPAFAAGFTWEKWPTPCCSPARMRTGGLSAAGYPFRYPDLETALRYLLGRIV